VDLPPGSVPRTEPIKFFMRDFIVNRSWNCQTFGPTFQDPYAKNVPLMGPIALPSPTNSSFECAHILLYVPERISFCKVKVGSGRDSGRARERPGAVRFVGATGAPIWPLHPAKNKVLTTTYNTWSKRKVIMLLPAPRA